MLVLRHESGCSSTVEFQPSKLATWVRLPSPAPSFAPRLSLRSGGSFRLRQGFGGQAGWQAIPGKEWAGGEERFRRPVRSCPGIVPLSRSDAGPPVFLVSPKSRLGGTKEDRLPCEALAKQGLCFRGRAPLLLQLHAVIAILDLRIQERFDPAIRVRRPSREFNTSSMRGRRLFCSRISVR